MFTEYSLWWLLLIVAICLGYVSIMFLHGRDKAFSNRKRIILACLRFVSLFLILFLFLSPVRVQKNKTIEKPTIIFAQDNSSSLTSTKDSTYYRKEYLKSIDKLADKLEKDFNVVKLNFGNKTIEVRNNSFFQGSDFLDFASDFSDLYSCISEQYSQENLSAVILATDGIATQNESVLSWDYSLDCPIYTIALGDNSIRKDIRVSNVIYNKVAFLDNEYPLEISVVANKAKGEKASLFMDKNGKRTLLKNFSIDADDFSFTHSLATIAQKTGTEKISFFVSYIDNEDNKANNRKDIYVDVIDSRKKILLLASSVHPDIAVFRQVIESNKNYECDFSLSNDIGKIKSFDNYDMIVLHNLPDNSNSNNLIKQIIEKDIPILFVIGQNTNIALFNTLHTNLHIQPLSNTMNQAMAVANNSFSLFTINDDTKNIIKDFPPLLSPTAKYDFENTANILMYQKIESVATNYPLIAFSEKNNKARMGFVIGENIWRWRINNFLINQTHNESDEIIQKTIQLVADKTKNSHFHIEKKDIYSQNEDVVINAQLYNDNFELINTSDVEIAITFNNKTQNYIFGKTSNAYHLNLSKLKEGEYTYIAKTTFNNKTYSEKGSFVVTAIAMEQSDLRAKHSDLFTLSKKTDGKMISPKEVEKLYDLIKNNPQIKPIIHESIENRRFISLWWYWLLIILSLGGEWFLRKYWGKI